MTFVILQISLTLNFGVCEQVHLKDLRSHSHFGELKLLERQKNQPERYCFPPS